MSGAVISWGGCCLKCFSWRQEVPALSSAEAEAIAIAEASKELVAPGMLIAAISISTMEGLLRRVKHMELRA